MADASAANSASTLPVRIRMLRCLADGGFGAVAGYTLLQLANVLLPSATALATAAVISEISRHGGQPRAFSYAVPPLIYLAAAMVAAQLIAAFLWPAADLVRTRIDAVHRERLARLAVGAPTIVELERPEVQDLIKAASGESTNWVEKTPSDGALGQWNMILRYLGMIASALVLARYSWWLIPVVVIPAVALRRMSVTRWLSHFRIWRAGLGEHRRYWYWGRIAISPAEGKELRVFGLEQWLLDRGQRHIHAHMDPVWEDDLRAARAKWKYALLTFFPLAAVFAFVGIGTAHGHGTLAAETVVLTSAWAVFQAIMFTFDTVAVEGAIPVMEAAHALERVLAGTARGMAPEPAAVDEGRTPLVRFEGVGFSYPESTRPVLRGLDLEIRPGELLAVVGLNGAGKSTMTKILAGLYEPVAGRVTADGADIRGLGYEAWRTRLSVVFQDFVKYPLSARENVVLGRRGLEGGDLDAALEQAARDSGFDQVLERLPLGWDTPLSKTREHGVDLSGGQWQQVALARALFAVRNGARVLVLDEPTAHLDVRTEFEVFARLADVAGQASVVLISHRLSTVRQADRIVLLDGGRIVESGSHDELIERGGGYAEMFAVQAERFRGGFEDVLEEGELR